MTATSVIDLRIPFGAMRGSLVRHWTAAERPMTRYDFVLEGMGSVYSWPIDRLVAAKMLAGDRRASLLLPVGV